MDRPSVSLLDREHPLYAELELQLLYEVEAARDPVRARLGRECEQVLALGG